MEFEPKKRTDLIGLTGSVTRSLTVIDALEYPTGVSVRVSDNVGEEYWIELDDIDFD